MNQYKRLIIAVMLITLASSLLSIREFALGIWQFSNLASDLMAGFFLVFGGLKLMDLNQFAEGFAKYDLIAAKSKFYAYLYPFIELSFGFLMLLKFHPAALLWAEFAIMIVGTIGIVNKIVKKENLRCACMGNLLDVPVGYVTIVENLSMAALALVLILI
ncbi:hypothetical protein KA036_02435 [Candidatus Gracilibacteria bacterium]|jgi:hypothetical protein|nr:hypothetical protein [Candidatus Gracilibacteria bacterium]